MLSAGFLVREAFSLRVSDIVNKLPLEEHKDGGENSSTQLVTL